MNLCLLHLVFKEALMEFLALGRKVDPHSLDILGTCHLSGQGRRVGEKIYTQLVVRGVNGPEEEKGRRKGGGIRMGTSRVR